MGIEVSENLTAELMRLAGIAGLPGPAEVTRLKGVATADDLVRRKFHRLSPNELWVTDITEHPTREGKVYCCAVMDTFSRKIVGWSIDNCQDSTLVVNALDMAIKNRTPPPGGIVHADHGVRFTNEIFSYIEIFYNPQRRHSQLDYGSPFEYELNFQSPPIPA